MWYSLGRSIITIPISFLHGHFIKHDYTGYHHSLISGIRIGSQSPTISHFFFAYDSLFFFKAFKDACESLVKSSPNIREANQQEYEPILRMNSHSSLGKYLRVPVNIQDNKIPHFTPLMEKISAIIARWSHKSLSQPYRLIIIDSILTASIMHQLAVFHIPTTKINKIDSMPARFF